MCERMCECKKEKKKKKKLPKQGRKSELLCSRLLPPIYSGGRSSRWPSGAVQSPTLGIHPGPGIRSLEQFHIIVSYLLQSC